MSLELQSKHPERNLKTTTYGAPVSSVSASGGRFRRRLDPTAILDFGAQTMLQKGLNRQSPGPDDEESCSVTKTESF